MDVLVAVLAAVVGFAAGWVAATFQHFLYREEEYRKHPATGRKALLLRAGAGVFAGVAAGLAFRPDHYDAGPALLSAAFCLALVALSSTDLERRRIPNRLSYPAMAAAAVFAWAWPDRDALDIAIGFGAALAAGAFFFGVGILAGRGATGFGLGDVKLILLGGLLLGWPLVVSGVFLGIMLAGVPALVLIALGRGRSRFAYGPYLSPGIGAALLFSGFFEL